MQHLARRVQVRFDSPSNGWLNGSIEIDDEKAGFHGSHTPADWLLQLVWALDTLVAGRDDVEAAVNAESHEYKFSFHTEEQATRLRLVRASPGADPEILIEALVPMDRLAIAFWRGLRNLESRMGESKLHWQHDFPHDALRRLEKRLRPGSTQTHD